MDKIFDVIIEGEGIGERIDKFLSSSISTLSRTNIQNLIKSSNVLVNGKEVKPSYKLEENDHIEVYDMESEDSDITPENIDINIVYEDKDIVIINKDKGMVVHPSIGHYKDTLVNALLYHIKDLSTINGVVRPGIVHRIDKDTTGLLVVAKNDYAHVKLQEQLKDKTMYRKYLALVYGTFELDDGVIDAPIGRDIKDRQKMAVIKTGKDAITHFKVKERFKQFTLLECRLETGRTHQIRVHMNYIDHPIVSDPVYGTRKPYDNKGQYLHAYELSFIHPTKNERVTFTVPLPEYFENLLKELRGNPQ